MEEGPIEPLDGTKRRWRVPTGTAIQCVPDDRVSDGAQMHPDLVGATRRDGDFQKGRTSQRFRPGDAGQRRAPTSRPRRDFLTLHWVPTEGEVYAATCLNDAPDEDGVALLDLAFLELSCELGVGAVMLGHHHHSRGSTVQSVDDPRSELAANTAQVSDMVQEGIDECAVRVSRRWVNDHARRLVDHDQVDVVVQDIDREGLGTRLGRHRGRDLNRDDVAHPDEGARASRLVADSRPPGFDQALDLRACTVAQTRNQYMVDALVGLHVGHLHGDHLRWVHVLAHGAHHGLLGGTRARGGRSRLGRLGPSQDDQHHDARRDEQQRYEL